MPDGLAAFIAERLDEAETAAKAASPGPWFSWIEGRDHRGGDSFIQTAGNYDMTVNYQVREYGPEGIAQWQADQDYIAANDPARELRAITAKRAILAAHKTTVTERETYPFSAATGEPIPAEYDGDCEICGWFDPGQGGCLTVRQLGTEWNDHPAYLPEWSPELADA